MKWVKIRKEHGRFVVGSTAKPDPHPKGVSISTERVRDENGQHTIERIAVDGVVQHEYHCYNGQQRNQAFVKATSYYA